MMPDREKVMKELSWLILNFPVQINPIDAADKMCNAINAYCNDALALLQEQEARLMSREEIEGSDGTEFYSEHKGEEYLYMDHIEGPAYLMGNMERFRLKNLRWENYGKTWRCWTAKPTDEQRKTVKWDE